MLIGVVVAVCVVLFVLALLAPRLSRKPQGTVDRSLGVAARASSHAPGPLGRRLAPFRSSQRAADRSASAGRKIRKKIS